mmetsp:Transcript_76702/g.185343  ORF Transcript_76702/g.185343 Transcript_76702/m.185343 type:complete len:269 (-) Transcript_76702:217-1023(-)
MYNVQGKQHQRSSTDVSIVCSESTALNVKLLARTDHPPHSDVAEQHSALAALPAARARARLDIGAYVLEVLEHVWLSRQEGLGLGATSHVLLERRVDGELERRVNVHDDHLVPCNPRCVGEHAPPRLARHLVRCKHDGHDVLREGLAVGLGVALEKGAVGVDEVSHAQESWARVDACRPRRRAEPGAAAQIEHRRSEWNRCVDPRSHIDPVVRETIDEARHKGCHESMEPTAEPNVAKPVDSLVEPVRRALRAQRCRSLHVARDCIGW